MGEWIGVAQNPRERGHPGTNRYSCDLRTGRQRFVQEEERMPTEPGGCGTIRPMIILLIILILLIGGGGYYAGPGWGYYGGGGLDLVLLIVLLYILFGRRRTL